MVFKDPAKTNGAQLGAVAGMIHLDCRVDLVEGQSKLVIVVVDISELGIWETGVRGLIKMWRFLANYCETRVQ